MTVRFHPARPAATFAVALVLAAALAGCMNDAPSAPPSSDDDTGGGLGNSSTNTTNTTLPNGTANTTTPNGTTPNAPFTPSNGTRTFSTSGEAEFDVGAGASSLDVAFAKSGVLGGTFVSFRAILLDSNRTEVATSSDPGTGFTVTKPAAGTWTLRVELQAAPTESVTATWNVS